MCAGLDCRIETLPRERFLVTKTLTSMFSIVPKAQSSKQRAFCVLKLQHIGVVISNGVVCSNDSGLWGLSHCQSLLLH
jgi:hypothetical protein